MMKQTIHNFLEFFREKGQLKHIRKSALSVREKYLFQNTPSKMLKGREEHLAYTLYRMPATYAAVKRALEHVKEALPDFSPKTILDLGTGPGTALLAARELFPEMEQALGLERNEEFIELFEECFSFFQEKRVEAKLCSLEENFPNTPFDLVIASYSFNELEDVIVQKWMQWARDNAKVLVIVEPGTPSASEKMLALREQCQEGLIVAPCPHAHCCPLKKKEQAWCHESIRLSRSFIHRYMKEGTLSYEDEKFCYLGVLFDSSLKTAVPFCRVVNTPRHRSGHTYLSLCTKAGILSESIISRKRKELYALAKRARWGDSFPNPEKQQET